MAIFLFFLDKVENKPHATIIFMHIISHFMVIPKGILSNRCFYFFDDKIYVEITKGITQWQY